MEINEQLSWRDPPSPASTHRFDQAEKVCTVCLISKQVVIAKRLWCETDEGRAWLEAVGKEGLRFRSFAKLTAGQDGPGRVTLFLSDVLTGTVQVKFSPCQWAAFQRLVGAIR